MFEARTQAETLEEMKRFYSDAFDGDLSTIEGTFVGDNLSANAVEFEKAYAEMSLIVEAGFAQTSWGRFLTMRAAEFGIDRKAAVKAVGMVTVKGNGTVESGAIFATDAGVQFQATQTVAIDGETDVPIEAITAGENGNVAAGTITKIPIAINGITAVTNDAETTDGYDEETDESLLNRLLLHVRNPITSGNANHYREWALSVAGVGNCQVIPLWNGNGTVKVSIIDENKDIASETLIKKVADYLDEVKPIGATVTVTTPTYMDITVSARITVTAAYKDTYKDVLKKAINDYFVDEGFTSTSSTVATIISIAKIGKIMLATGAITDYDELKLQGDIKNITIDAEKLPRLTTLEVTEFE